MATRTYPVPCLFALYDKYAIEETIKMGPITTPAIPANPMHAIPPTIRPATEIYFTSLLVFFMDDIFYTLKMYDSFIFDLYIL